jgi:hypothetical protein
MKEAIRKRKKQQTFASATVLLLEIMTPLKHLLSFSFSFFFTNQFSPA